MSFAPAIAAYQSTLSQLKKHGHSTESQTRRAFAQILSTISNERGLTYADEFPLAIAARNDLMVLCSIGTGNFIMNVRS